MQSLFAWFDLVRPLWLLVPVASIFADGVADLPIFNGLLPSHTEAFDLCLDPRKFFRFFGFKSCPIDIPAVEVRYATKFVFVIHRVQLPPLHES